VLGELGQAALRVDPGSAVEYLREAIGLVDDDEQRGLIEWLLGEALYVAGRSSEAIDVLEATLAAGPLPTRLQERLEYELVNALVGDVQMERAVELAEAMYQQHAEGLRDTGHLSLAVLVWVAHILPLSRRESAAFAEAALADDVLLREETDAFLTAAFGLLGADDYEGARVAFDKVRERAVGRGSVLAFAWSANLGARLFYFLGQLGEAEAEARVGLDAAESHGLEAIRPWLAAALADVLIDRGRLDEAAALVRSARSSDPKRELFDLLVTDMELHLALGRPEAALQALAELHRRFDGTRGGDVPAPFAWRSTGARVLAALGRTGEALELARTDAEFARRWGAPRPLGRVLRILGTLEVGAAGMAALREAVSVLEDSPARLELAHALAALGSAIRRSGQRVEARELLRRALELSHLCGAYALESQVREELVVAGARPRRVRLHGVDSLTASELRVAQLAASGKANKEIAQALFVSLKTVEMHLASGYRKLDISSRTQLPAVLGGA
jgi:ATP/maltotriose-dependent transcriptional regulator MalT